MQTVGRAGGYAQLLLDSDLRRWYDNVRRGSPITADVYLRRLGSTCRRRNVTPIELVGRIRGEGERSAYNFLVDLVTELEREGKAGSYIASNVKAVKSWLTHNGMEVRGKIRIRGANETPSLATKHAPSLSELGRLFANCAPRTRSAASLVAEAGLRLEAVGNYHGTDGLTLGDLPGMKVQTISGSSSDTEDFVTFIRILTMIIVRQELSKAGHQYFTFLTKEGVNIWRNILHKESSRGKG